MTPATIDRRTQFVGGVTESALTPIAWLVSGLPSGPFAKTLSRSPTGAASVLVNFPEAWSSGRGTLSCPVDLFVTSGSLLINGIAVGDYGFCSIPSGHVVEIDVDDHAVALAFHDGPLWFTTSANQVAQLDVVDVRSLRWRPPMHPDIPPGLLIKEIHRREAANTWLIGALQWGIGTWERHPVVEECFFLEGEMTVSEMLDSGTRSFSYSAGGYFYRPPGIWHSGPESRTESYALILARSDGVLDTEFSDEPTGVMT